MTSRKLPLILALTVAIGTAAWSSALAGDEWVGKAGAPFALKDLQGNPLNLADLLGKKVVWLNFWGLRCAPCIQELPALQKIYETYADKGLLLIGVDTDGVDAKFLQDQLSSRQDLKAAGITFPIAPDQDFAVIDAYGLEGAPLNIIIDKKGIIRFRHEGYEEGDEKRYVEALKPLLAE